MISEDILPPDIKVVRLMPADVLVVSNWGTDLTDIQLGKVADKFKELTGARDVLAIGPDVHLGIIRSEDTV